MAGLVTTSESAGPTIHPGLRVETVDGRRVGVVADVGQDSFLTQRRYREDFWLPDVFIRKVDAARIVLHVDSRGLRRYTPRERSFSRPLIALRVFAVATLTAMLGFGV